MAFTEYFPCTTYHKLDRIDQIHYNQKALYSLWILICTPPGIALRVSITITLDLVSGTVALIPYALRRSLMLICAPGISEVVTGSCSWYLWTMA